MQTLFKFFGGTMKDVGHALQVLEEQKSILSDQSKLERVAARMPQILMPIAEVHSAAYGDAYDIGEKCLVLTLMSGANIVALRGLTLDEVAKTLDMRETQRIEQIPTAISYLLSQLVELEVLP